MKTATITDPTKLPGIGWHNPINCDREDDEGHPIPCVIHHPSHHHMRKWPCRLMTTTLIQRQCPHMYWHPDPDAARYFQSGVKWKVLRHNCDGCCDYERTTPLAPEDSETRREH